MGLDNQKIIALEFAKTHQTHVKSQDDFVDYLNAFIGILTYIHLDADEDQKKEFLDAFDRNLRKCINEL